MMSVKDKIKGGFGWSVKSVGSRPDGLMSDNMNHYLISVKARDGGGSASFYYSEGFGVKSPLGEKGFGLISSLFLDSQYEDLEGMGYSPAEEKKIWKAMQKNKAKLSKIGMLAFFDSLSEREKEKLSEGL